MRYKAHPHRYDEKNKKKEESICYKDTKKLNRHYCVL